MKGVKVLGQSTWEIKSRLGEVKMQGKEKPKPTFADRFKNMRLFKMFGKLFMPKPSPFNMPKYQPCPDCHANSRRTQKITTGAMYDCRNHGEFLVRRA